MVAMTKSEGRKKSARHRRGRSKFFTIDGPRKLFDNTTGETLRVVFYEDRKERQAIELLRSLYEKRVERIHRLCLIEPAGMGVAGKRAEPFFRFSIHPGETEIENISKPWRRGTKRAMAIFEGDRPALWGGVAYRFHSWWASQMQPEPSMAKKMIDELTSMAKSLQDIAAKIKADVRNNPREWMPIPTIGELLHEPEGGAF